MVAGIGHDDRAIGSDRQTYGADHLPIAAAT
jgi:hypothetical protein